VKFYRYSREVLGMVVNFTSNYDPRSLERSACIPVLVRPNFPKPCRSPWSRVPTYCGVLGGGKINLGIALAVSWQAQRHNYL
jgi:hypothetical protein